MVGTLWHFPVFANSHIFRFTFCHFSPCGCRSGVGSRNLLVFFFIHLFKICNCLHYGRLLLALWVILVSRLFTRLWWWSFGCWLTRPDSLLPGEVLLSVLLHSCSVQGPWDLAIPSSSCAHSGCRARSSAHSPSRKAHTLCCTPNPYFAVLSISLPGAQQRTWAGRSYASRPWPEAGVRERTTCP